MNHSPGIPLGIEYNAPLVDIFSIRLIMEETIQALLKKIKLFKSEMANLPLEFEKTTEETTNCYKVLPS